jgi:hypothetical protein
MIFLWKPEKNETLKQERNISFEAVVQALVDGGFRDVFEYRGTKKIHEGQLVMLVEIEEDLWKVPFTIPGNYIFLRTIYPA